MTTRDPSEHPMAETLGRAVDMAARWGVAWFAAPQALTFAHQVGLVLAVPILLILLVAVHVARPRKRKSLRDRVREANQ